MCRLLKGGHSDPIDNVPTVGKYAGMTLKEYIKAGHATITQIGLSVGVSEHAVRKWVYGQREPDIETAIKLSEITGGAVTVAELARSVAGSREAA